jgi:hypothetical protein
LQLPEQRKEGVEQTTNVLKRPWKIAKNKGTFNPKNN